MSLPLTYFCYHSIPVYTLLDPSRCSLEELSLYHSPVLFQIQKKSLLTWMGSNINVFVRFAVKTVSNLHFKCTKVSIDFL